MIISSVKMMSTAQTTPMLINRPNNPKVKSRRGRVINFKIGLIKKLIKPKISPANNKIFQSPVKSTPVTNLSASQSPKTPEIIAKRSLVPMGLL